jgi:hypothetical protein
MSKANALSQSRSAANKPQDKEKERLVKDADKEKGEDKKDGLILGERAELVTENGEPLREGLDPNNPFHMRYNRAHDETAPGGYYIVNGKEVNARGLEFSDDPEENLMPTREERNVEEQIPA